MINKEPRQPSPDHPISIERNPHRVVITVAGRVVAETGSALTLREAKYAPVFYIPQHDIDITLLKLTDHTTYCPYKGDCTYYSIPIGGEKSVNAVWSYEEPYSFVDVIAGHFAFYPDRIESIKELAV